MRTVVACICLLLVGSRGVFGQDTAPDIDVSPSPFDYGAVAVGDLRDHSFAISNVGTASLIVLATEIQGTDADQFRLTSGGGGFILSPGGIRLISVRFTPTSVGSKSAVIRMETNDPDENPFEINLTGEGFGLPDISAAPASLSFNNVPFGTTALLDVVVTNQGAIDLQLTATELTGLDAALFRIERGAAPLTIAPQQRDTITVSFTPPSAGTRNAVLRLLSNDPDESPLDIALTGRGIVADIQADAAGHDFGEVAVGANAVHLFTVTNVGEADLEVDSLALLGPDADAFQITRGDPPFVLRTGRSQQITVQFVPATGGPKNAVLRLLSNDPNKPELDLSLQGTALTPSLTLSASSLAFGAVLVSLDSTQTFTLTNAGRAGLVVSEVSVSGGDSTQFVVGGSRPPFSVAPSASLNLDIRFLPTSAGAKSTTLRIVSNDPDQPERLVALSGAGSTVGVDVAAAAMLGEEAAVSFLLPPSFRPVEKQLFYRSAGESTFRTAELTETGDGFRGLFPAPAVTLAGVEYYARLSDGRQTVTVPASDPQIHPLFLPARVAQLEAPVSFQPWTYRMISMPLQLDDPAVAAVLGDDYGPENTRRWRVFRWNAARDDYDEFPALAASLTPGVGLWLITNDGAPFDVENGQSIDPAAPFTLTLQPGWNQVGNPYAFSITWPGAVIDPRIEAPVSYGNAEFEYDQTTLDPWEGFFVHNNAATPISISLSEALRSNASATEDAASKSSLHAAAPYRLRLSAEVEGLPLRDTKNFLGLLDDALEERDAFDVTEAPPIGDYVRLSIVEQDKRYAGSFKPASGTGRHWDLEIDGTFSARSVRVRLAAEGGLPDGYGLYVLDQDRRNAVALADSSFSVDVGEAFQSRHLRLILGTKQYAEAHGDEIPLVPLSFGLEQNYPNPFNPSTTIRYRLSAQRAVLLEIYNLLGQRVRTLVQATQDAGSYAVEWDGSNDDGTAVASGVYLYRLAAGDFIATRKMLLIR